MNCGFKTGCECQFRKDSRKQIKHNFILFYFFLILNYAPSSLSGTSVFACKNCFIS